MRAFSFPSTVRAAAIAAIASLAVLSGGAALAQPANDNWAAREAIASLPFADTEAAIGLATVEGTDPVLTCRLTAAGPGGNTVWYTYTTGGSTEYVNLSTQTSTYDTVVSVYTGTAGSFQLVAGGCNDDGVAAVFQSRINGLRLAPSTTYSIEVARFTASAAAVTLNFSMTAAPVYTVTKPADTADGTCDADCSLREAITASNATPGAVVIPAGPHAITLAGASEDNNATGDFDVRFGMGIYGAGPGATTVDAGDLDRVFHVDPQGSGRVTAIFRDLTVTNATTTGDGGGISLANTNDFLAVDNLAVTNNVSTLLNGGGIRSASRATIWNSTISGNIASSNGGGLSFSGGLDATVEVANCTIFNNFSQSALSGGGGGIHSTARLRLSQSTVSGNRANFAGGGVYETASGSFEIRSSTIVNNTSDFDANNSGQGGGVRFESSATTSVITNTVIANNVDNSTTAPAPDCSRTAGTIASSYNHVEAVGSCAFFTGTGDVTGTDPNLAVGLATNGGPTQTHAILVGSPLIDAGNPGGCSDYPGAARGVTLSFDQRGNPYTRAFNGDGAGGAECDKGAFEFGATPVELTRFSAD